MNSSHYTILKYWKVKEEEIKYEFHKTVTTANNYLLVKKEQSDIVRIWVVMVKFLIKATGLHLQWNNKKQITNIFCKRKRKISAKVDGAYAVSRLQKKNFFSFFHWRCSPLWALACHTISFHFFLSVTNSLHLLTPSTWRSLSTSSFHPLLGLPLCLIPSSSWIKIFLGILSSSIFSR